MENIWGAIAMNLPIQVNAAVAGQSVVVQINLLGGVISVNAPLPLDVAEQHLKAMQVAVMQLRAEQAVTQSIILGNGQ
jgi:hypothetical protein